MSQKPHDRTMAIDRSSLDAGRFRKEHAALVVLQGAEFGRNFRVRRGRMIVGRGFGAEIRLADDLASREHARVECLWDPATQVTTYRIVDLGSTNHTFVNSTRVESADLREGDKIQIGDTVLKFVLLDDIEAKCQRLFAQSREIRPGRAAQHAFLARVHGEIGRAHV